MPLQVQPIYKRTSQIYFSNVACDSHDEVSNMYNVTFMLPSMIEQDIGVPLAAE